MMANPRRMTLALVAGKAVRLTKMIATKQDVKKAPWKEPKMTMEEQAELLQRLEMEQMMMEDSRSFAMEAKGRTAKMLQANMREAQRRKQEQKDKQERERAILRDEGLQMRFGRDVQFECWRTSPQLISTLLGHDGAIQDMVLLHQSEKLMTASADGTIRIWNWENQQCIARLDSVHARALGFRHEADLKLDRLFLGSNDGRIFQWFKPEDETHDGVVYALRFSRDGSRLATCSDDGTIKLWDISIDGAQSKQDIALLWTYTGHKGAATCVEFSADGRYLISGGDLEDPTIRLWDAHRHAMMENRMGDEIWYDDECCDCNALKHRAAEMETDLLKPEVQASIIGCSENENKISHINEMDTEAKALQVIELEDKFSRHFNGLIRVFHTHDWKRTKLSHSDWVNEVVTNKAGDKVLSCGSDNTVRLWTVPEGKQIKALFCEDWVMHCLFLSPTNEGSERVATCMANSSVEIWDLTNANRLSIFHGHSDAVFKGIFNVSSVHGEVLHTCSHDGTVRTWKLQSGPPLKPKAPTITEVSQFALTLKWFLPIENGSRVHEFILLRRVNEMGDFQEFPNCTVQVKPENKLNVFQRRINELSPGCKYEFTVVAVNQFGKSQRSDPSNARRCSSSVPVRGEAPVINFTTATSADLSWIAPRSMGAHIQSFVIRYRGGECRCFEDSPELIVQWKQAKAKAETDAQEREQRRKAAAKWLHENPGRGTKESIRVRRQMQQDVEMQRKHDLLRVVALSRSEEHDQPNTAMGLGKQDFVLEGKNTLSLDQCLMEMSAIVHGLKPGTTYQFCVAARNKLGLGEFSAPSCSEETQASVPGKPGKPRLLTRTTNSASIEWSVGSTNGAILTAYSVRFGETSLMDELESCLSKCKENSDRAREILCRASGLRTKITRLINDRLDSRKIIELKYISNASEATISLLNACIFVAKCRGDEQEMTSFRLPELKSELRHPEQFIELIRAARSVCMDPEAAIEQRPVMKPLPAWFVAMAREDIIAKPIMEEQGSILGFLQVMREWLILQLDLNQSFYVRAHAYLSSLERCRVEAKTKSKTVDQSLIQVEAKENKATILGLASGRSYRFQVRAHNSLGPGPYSDASPPIEIEIGPPSCPRQVRGFGATPVTISVQWDAPESSNGREILGYTLFLQFDKLGPFREVLENDITWLDPDQGRGLRATVSNLPPDTFCRFKVRAFNELGIGELSDESEPLSTSPAQAPGRISTRPKVCERSPRSVTISWDPPQFDGGDAIIQYKIFMRIDHHEQFLLVKQVPCEKPSSTQIVKIEHEALGPEAVASFKICAVNSIGSGPLSDASEPIGLPTEKEYVRDIGPQSSTVEYIS